MTNDFRSSHAPIPLPDMPKFQAGDPILPREPKLPLPSDLLERIRSGTPEGLKFDTGKPRFDLIPPLAEREVAKVLTHGAAKYGPRNWRLVKDHNDRYVAAMRRHVNAFMAGEIPDPDTKLHHIAHAICSLLFILEIELEAQGAKVPS